MLPLRTVRLRCCGGVVREKGRADGNAEWAEEGNSSPYIYSPFLFLFFSVLDFYFKFEFKSEFQTLV